MPTITVQNLSKNYAYYKKEAGLKGTLLHLFNRQKLFTNAVKEISFTIGEGELVGFLGPNGAGKTTTLKMLSGILYPTSGTAEVLGFTPWKRKREYLKQISIVMGQKAQLWWDLPARESFLLSRAIYDIAKTDYQKRLKFLSKMLDVVALLDIPIRKLSLGERMKMELINSLLHSPRVLFLDEPTIGLDVVAQKTMRDFLRDYNQKYGTTILLTSHYMEDVEALCKRVIVVNDGEIMYDGLLKSVIDRFAPYKVLKLTFLKEVRKQDFASYGDITHFESIKAELTVPRDKTTSIAAEILQKFPVDDIIIDEMGIEDVVRRMFLQNKS
jgi:ABC-2 type transport system ATP-binding protein